MIFIKDKGNRTQIFIPRNGEINVNYATQSDIEQLNDRINFIMGNYATKEYVNDALDGIADQLIEINTRLQNILYNE